MVSHEHQSDGLFASCNFDNYQNFLEELVTRHYLGETRSAGEWGYDN